MGAVMNIRASGFCLVFAFLLVGLVIPHSSRGIIIASDDFDYPLGATVAENGTLGATTNGFGNAWKFSAGATGTVVGNLSYNNLSSSGNALQLSNSSGASAYIFRGLTGTLPAGTYYMSFLMLRQDNNDANSENWSWQLKNSASYSLGPTSSTKFTVGSSPTEEALALVTGDTTQLGDTYSVADTYIMLTKFVIDDVGSETASVVFYGAGDSLPTSEGAIVWDATSTGSYTGGSGWRFNLPINLTLATIDEFRLGTELKDVLPAPRRLGLFLVY